MCVTHLILLASTNLLVRRINDMMFYYVTLTLSV